MCWLSGHRVPRRQSSPRADYHRDQREPEREYHQWLREQERERRALPAWRAARLDPMEVLREE